MIQSSEILLFADDAKIFKEITTNVEFQNLQSDFDGIVEWCIHNEMELVQSKCSMIIFSRTESPYIADYSSDSSALRRVDFVNDLGVVISSDLSPENHMSNICNRANILLRFIVRVSRDQCSMNALRTLCIHLVRPLIEYSSTVWSLYHLGHKITLEDNIKQTWL